MTEAAQTDGILAAAKRDWRRNFAGAMMTKNPKFKTPTVRHYFARQYDQLGRNVYFISIFGRILVKGDGVSEAERSIYDRIRNVGDECAKKVNAMKAIAAEAGITDLASYPLADKRDITAFVIVPAQNRFLKVLEIADDYLVMVNTLWLEGEITDKAKSQAEMEIKHQLGQVVSMVRRMRILTQSKVREAQRAVADAAGTDKDAAAKAAELSQAQEQVAASEDIRSEGVDDEPTGNDEPSELEGEAVAA
ncbi:MAG: hypothetical protein AzoDbin1_01885 [Azoarcus sp.]|nr:hypothetical protein [Azoarcus sp.]